MGSAAATAFWAAGAGAERLGERGGGGGATVGTGDKGRHRRPGGREGEGRGGEACPACAGAVAVRRRAVTR